MANGDDTLSITADCYSIAAADAALAAALLAYYTSAQVDALLVDYRTGTAQDAETTSAILAALLAAGGRAVADYADAGRHRGRAAGLPDGPGPGRLHDQPDHLSAGGAPLGRRPGHGDGLEHCRQRCAGGRFAKLGAASAGDSRALSGQRFGGRHQILGPTDVSLANCLDWLLGDEAQGQPPEPAQGKVRQDGLTWFPTNPSDIFDQALAFLETGAQGLGAEGDRIRFGLTRAASGVDRHCEFLHLFGPGSSGKDVLLLILLRFLGREGNIFLSPARLGAIAIGHETKCTSDLLVKRDR